MAFSYNDFQTNVTANNLTNQGTTEWTTNFPFASCTEAIAGDGTQYCTVNDNVNLSITGDLTMELWTRLDTKNDNGTLIAKRNATTNNRSFSLQFTDNTSGSQLGFSASSNGTANDGNVTSAGNAVTDTNWHHIAVVYTAAAHTIQFYVDGAVFEGARDCTITSIFDGNAPLTLMTEATLDAGYFLTGKMTQVRVWNVARSAAQIAANYNKFVSPTSTGLVAYYPGQTIILEGGGAFLLNFL